MSRTEASYYYTENPYINAKPRSKDRERQIENKVETEKKKTYFTIYDDSLGHFSQTFRRLLVLLLFFEKTAYTIKQYSRNS